MALTIENGDGIPGADAYEDDAAVVDRLLSQGLFAFRKFSAERRETVIRDHTAQVDAFLDNFQTGRIKKDDQGLLFPRLDAFDRAGREIDDLTVPKQILTGNSLRFESFAEREELRSKCDPGKIAPEADLSFRQASGRGYPYFLQLMDEGP